MKFSLPRSVPAASIEMSQGAGIGTMVNTASAFGASCANPLLVNRASVIN
jgi:hypothetical protein